MRKLVFFLIFLPSICFSQVVGQHWIWTASGPRWSTFSGSGAAWGSITGTLSSQTDLNNALNLKSPLASPTFTGTAIFRGDIIDSSQIILDNPSYIGRITLLENAADYKPTIRSNTNMYYDVGGGANHYWTLNNVTAMTLSSTAALTVKGANGIYAEDAASGRQIQFIPPTVSTNGTIQTNGTANGLLIKSSGGGNQLFLKDDGFVGLGTVAPGFRLDVSGSSRTYGGFSQIQLMQGVVATSAGFRWSLANNGTLYYQYGRDDFAVIAKTYMFVDSFANVSMGTGQTFQVLGATGDISKIKNIPYSWPTVQGGVSTQLTNDGSGNLTWSDENSNAGKIYRIEDEFVSSNGGGQTGIISYVTSGIVAQGAIQDSNRWGIITLTTGTAINTGAGAGWGTVNMSLSGGSSIYEVELRLSRRYTAANGNDDYVLLIGWLNTPSITASIEGSDGAYFYIHNDSNSFKPITVTRRGGSQTRVWTTAATIDTTLFYKYRIEVNNVASSVVFKINGTTVSTMSTASTIPTGKGFPVGPNFKLVKVGTSVTPATNTILVDRAYIQKTYVPVR